MKTSEKIEELSTSLIKLQGCVTNIGKDSSGYGYKYTSLDKLLEHIKPLMLENGLGLIQTPTSVDNRIGVTTRLIHTSGQFIEDTLLMEKSNLAKMNDYQVAGSIISYFRRYAISSILGIASEEDIDVNIQLQHKTQAKTKPTIQTKQYSINDIKQLAELKQFDISAIETAYGCKLEKFTLKQLNTAYSTLQKK